jgi:hypothetical protein
MNMSKEQVSRLHRAIDRAEMFGGFQYVAFHRPICVMGHLAVSEGATIGQLRTWESDPIANVIKEGQAPMLAGYPLKLLGGLQVIWDGMSWPDNPGRAKRAMHGLVDQMVRRQANTLAK